MTGPVQPSAGGFGVRDAIHPAESSPPIDAKTAVFAFIAAWFAAQVLSVIMLGVFGETGGSDTPIGVLAVVLCICRSGPCGQGRSPMTSCGEMRRGSSTEPQV